MPVSEIMTQSEIQRVLDNNQIKHIHFGHVAIFSSAGLLIALVRFRPPTTMSEVAVNQWDELSQFLFHDRKFTNPIATNGALLEGFMFAIGWRKCSTKNEQFGLYGSLGKIENEKDEWLKQGANLNSVGCIGAFEFASALTFTMNGFKNSHHLDKDAFCMLWDGDFKLISGLAKFKEVVWASSTFVHYTDPAHDNESTTLVGMSAQCSGQLAKTMWRKSHGYYEIGEEEGYHIRDGNTISSQ
ncbi:hypothetical protein O181_063758 [Austropuccinia psidii MF-1]|uniref:Tet-like 2OG-Fe(II) oxygenase domain-containing protein n=1 Tax=Austropuccinia psidii MF-1 TaxID=1389203 RepID=A0A9Q3ELV6_9BASI|nr:hypothetical protein [Austropuccinia psidii MF-1]